MGMVKISISPPRPLPEDEALPCTLTKARTLYAATGEDDRALAEDFLAVAVETLPPYEEAGP
jgi:hypothetical protein